MEFNWLDLPDHILSLIADKFIHSKDYVRFGAVCHSWRSVYIENQRSLPRQLPFLMLSTELNLDDETRSIYSLTEKKVSNFLLPVPLDLLCRGSSHGWLVTVGENHNVSLLNPFMSVNNVIKLPPLTESGRQYPLGNSHFLSKFVLSADPASNPNFVAMAIYGFFKRLAFFKPGDKSWTSLSLASIMDVIYYRDQFYAVNNFGQVFTCDLNGHHAKVSTAALPAGVFSIRRYLVELNGNLLQALRGMYFDGCKFKFNFVVFKLDQIWNKWIEMDNLHGSVLFLGDSSSLSLSASDFPECKPNSVYFTNSDYYYEPLQMGVYSFEHGTVEPHWPLQPKYAVPVPIWIEPPKVVVKSAPLDAIMAAGSKRKNSTSICIPTKSNQRWKITNGN